MEQPVLLRFQAPSEAALFADLKDLLTAAGMGGFLPEHEREMTLPWRRAGYRLDWVFFRLVRRVDEVETEWDRGLHCDVLVSRTDESKPLVIERLRTLAAKIAALEEIDHNSPDALLTRYGATRRRVRRASRGSVVIDSVAAPYHRFLGATDG